MVILNITLQFTFKHQSHLTSDQFYISQQLKVCYIFK